MKTTDILETVEWGEKHFGSLTSGESVRRRDLLRGVREGLLKSIGQVHICDGDGGMIYPERHREGFRLTKAGRERLREWRAGLSKGMIPE